MFSPVRCSSPSARVFFFCLAITAAAATAPSAQSPVTATLKQWDVFAATGGNGAATQNVTAVVVDNTGISGVAGSAWLTAQNPSARVGRVDPASPSLNYIEWRPVETDQGGAPL